MNIKLLLQGMWFETIEVEDMLAFAPGKHVVGNLGRIYKVLSVDMSGSNWPRVEVEAVDAKS